MPRKRRGSFLIPLLLLGVLLLSCSSEKVTGIPADSVTASSQPAALPSSSYESAEFADSSASSATPAATPVGEASTKTSAHDSGEPHDHGATEVQPFRPGEHLDHSPKHGGTFFMALDNKHHLEGVLLPPGIFCVYLYDARSRPLSLDTLQQTSGTVQWGESLDAPISPLAAGKSEARLEAEFQGNLRFPVMVNLKLRLPGSSAGVRPEVFTFPFSHFSGDRAGNHSHGPEEEHAAK